MKFEIKDKAFWWGLIFVVGVVLVFIYAPISFLTYQETQVHINQANPTTGMFIVPAGLVGAFYISYPLAVLGLLFSVFGWIEMSKYEKKEKV